MRNTKKNADQGREIVRKKERIDLAAEEVHQLIDKIAENPVGKLVINEVYDAVCDAFYMGVAVGTRNA